MAETELVVPEDVVDEILVRLPVKSIIRFESVCKGWQSKSHSTSFLELYEQQHDKREKKISASVHTIKLNDVYSMASPLWNDELPDDENMLKELDAAGPSEYNEILRYFPSNLTRRKISAIGPLSNGIYCLTSVVKYFTTGSEEVHNLRIAICNPSIQHLKFLPPFPAEFVPRLTQISDDGDARVFSGFGSDYSVVVVINYSFKNRSRRDCFTVFFYTSEKGWERIVDYIPNVKIEGSSKATLAFKGSSSILLTKEVCPQRFLNGCWHWMTRRGGNYKVLSFNFEHQSFSGISVPIVVESYCFFLDVIVLHGHLALICSRGAPLRYDEFDVWMMMDYDVEESWTRIFNIHTNYEDPFKLLSLYGLDYSVGQVDVEDQSESIVIEKLFFTHPGNGGKVISFDRHGSFEVSKTLHHHFENYVTFSTRGISTYMETIERL